MPNDILFFQMLPLESIKKFLYDRLAFSSHNIIWQISDFSHMWTDSQLPRERKREREIQNKSCRRMGFRGGHTGDKTEQNYNLPYLAKTYSLMKFLIIVVWLTVMNVNVNPPYFHGFYFRARVTDEGGLVVVWSDSQVSVEVEQQVNNPDLSLLSYSYWLTRD